MGGKLEAGSDASKARFFPLDELPKQMAFPTDLLVCEQINALIKNKKKVKNESSKTNQK
jgi:hypothetical protein